MTIRDEQRYLESLWDFAVFDGCFGAFSPTDIDALVEVDGNFLVMETKSPGADEVGPQKHALKALVQKAGAIVLVIWGTPGRPERIRVYSPKHPEGAEIKRELVSMENLRTLLHTWYCRVKGIEVTPPPPLLEEDT
jgi:hypothetical protein